jgi:ubiquinone/menaquinone biosynthesis C-methylase UbiE
MKLNIGGGDVRLEGFVNLDYDEYSKPDYVVDLEKDRFPFEDNTVETVVAHHVFEHLGEGYFHCLQELYRVCKHGAIVDIRVPHHRHDSFASDPTHRRPITIVGLQLFSKKFNKYCKDQGYASSRLGEFFNIDFEVLDYKYIPDDRCTVKFQSFTLEQLEDYTNEHNNIIKEVQVKLIVIKE